MLTACAELVKIRLEDVDLDACRIGITQGKDGKDRYVPFSSAFKETLALHTAALREKGAVFLFGVVVEEAILHPRRPRDARPLRRESRPGPQHAAPPLAALGHVRS